MGTLFLIGLAVAALLALKGSQGWAAVDTGDDEDDLWTNPDRWLDRGESHPPGREDWLHDTHDWRDSHES